MYDFRTRLLHRAGRTRREPSVDPRRQRRVDAVLAAWVIDRDITVTNSRGAFDRPIAARPDALAKALAAARKLRFGGVLINEVPPFRADQQPYGGVCDSGNTREGPRYAVAEMTDLRFVSLQ